MERVAVFCGSTNGVSDVYKKGAKQLGRELAKRQITLVYGGASVGLMGVIADTVLKEGGQAIGVVPSVLQEKELPHQHLTQLYVVDSMHERKAKMASLADGFITLPGGAGTMEEFFEVFTWAQIGLHQKPCGLLNINHYYDLLMAMFDHMVEQGFLQKKDRSIVTVDAKPTTLLDTLQTYNAY